MGPVRRRCVVRSGQRRTPLNARRIEISAIVSDPVASASTLQNANDLPEEVVNVTQRDIAGARVVRRSDARVVEEYRLAA